MKKFFLLALTFIVLCSSFGCVNFKKENTVIEDEKTICEKKLIGTWESTSGVVIETEQYFSFEGVFTITFNSDHSGKFYADGKNSSIVWSYISSDEERINFNVYLGKDNIPTCIVISDDVPEWKGQLFQIWGDENEDGVLYKKID